MTAPASGRDRSRPAATCRRCNLRILAWSGTRTTDSPRARSGRLHSLVLAAPAQRGPEVVPAKSDMRMVLVLLTSLRSFSSFWHGIARKRFLLVLRASVDIKSTEKSATMSRAFCTFFSQKGTQKSPADACAYSVPANVRNGRLFAGLQANRPRFLPLLAGTSFRGSGIGPGPFAAKRGGRDASGTSRKHRSLRSPLEAVLNRRILAWSGRRTTDSPRARSGRL